MNPCLIIPWLIYPRQPIANKGIKTIQNDCKKIDDEKRWLIALISDTGMRLSEAAGLSKDDLKVNESIILCRY